MAKSKSYRIAVGLRYRDGSGTAPSLSVNERSLNAEKVVGVARRFGVPVVERAELAQALSLLELDQEIPERYFEAVALILSRLQGQHTKGK